MFIVNDGNWISPSYQSAELGETVEFTCLSTSDVEWTKVDGFLESNVELGKKIGKNGIFIYWLKITNVRRSNAGFYHCRCDEDMIILEGDVKLKVKRKNRVVNETLL